MPNDEGWLGAVSSVPSERENVPFSTTPHEGSRLMLDLGGSTETNVEEYGGVGLLLDGVADERAQLRPLGEFDVIVLQRGPHPCELLVGTSSRCERISSGK